MRLPFLRKKIKESLDTEVYTTVHVVNEKTLITLVAHELDGDWQFLGNEPILEAFP